MPPAEKIFAVNSMSVEQLCTVRAYLMPCLCMKNNPLGPLAYGGVMFTKMHLVLCVVGTGMMALVLVRP